jgi:tetratricopeptide (TPR) repeat protein
MAQRELKRQALAKKIEIAQGYLDRSEFSATMDAAEEILEQHPDNVNAREMLNLAGYASGKALLEKGQEIEAIERLKKVDPSYSDTAQLLSLARARTRAAAETLYRDGVKQFINEDLERAIGTWQQALDLNPNHPKARQDMENAMRLLEKWRELEKPPQQ